MAILRYRDENGNAVPIRAIKGDKGDQMFIRFSAYPDGMDMVEEWDETRAYMGYAFGAKAPTDKSGYKWINLCTPFFGQYGVDGDYIFRVSNGTAEKPSNAMTIDADGNMKVGGEVTFGEDNFSPRKTADDLEKLVKNFDDHTAAATKIAVGSYIGNGKYGNAESLYTTLRFDFAPMLVVIRCVNSDNSDETLTCVVNGTSGRAHRVVGGVNNIDGLGTQCWGTSSNYLTSNGGKTIHFYNTYGSKAAQHQMNADGINYTYIAIGV